MQIGEGAFARQGQGIVGWRSIGKKRRNKGGGGHLTLSFAWFWDRPDVSSFFSPVSGVGSSNGIVDSSILPLVSSEKWISSTIFKAPGLDASGLMGSLFTASSENKDPIFFALVGQ